MKITLTSLAITLILITSTLIQSQTQFQEVGTLPGAVSISPSGAATYTIPIDLPPGRAGMEPQLALTYNSQGGNGLLGIGWAISGLSGISRIGTTLYHDGFIDGVDFDDNDQFALDGMRLIPVSQGGGNTEYRTEIETYSKIIGYGTYDDPDWFEVYTKDGQILEYGNTVNSRIEAVKDGQPRPEALVYNLNTVIDREGNYIDYVYHEDNSYGRIKEIVYTKHESLPSAKLYKVLFIYNGREDVIEHYLAGGTIRINKLLNYVEIRYNDQVIKTYGLSYDDDFYAHLKDVKLTDADNKSLNPTEFDWGQATQDFNYRSTTIPNTGENLIPEYIFGDFNGDGNTDIVCCYYVNGESDHISVYYSDGDGETFFESQDAVLNQYKDALLYYLPGDYNGDGLVDLAMITDVNYMVFFSQLTGNGHQFTNPYLTGSYQYQTPHYFHNVDLNGNGKDEVVLIGYNVEDTYNGGFITAISAYEYDDINNNMIPIIHMDNEDYYKFHHFESDLLEILPGDFDGDGKTDLLINKDFLRTEIMTLNGQQGSLKPLYSHPVLFPNKNHKHIKLGDFNGDGITDLLTGIDIHQDWELRYFNGSDAWVIGECPVEFPEGGSWHINYDNHKVMCSDFNGDGKTDILQFYEEYYDPGQGGGLEFQSSHFLAHYSDGLSYKTESDNPTSHNAFLERPYPINDFNGDGKHDCFIDNKTENDYIEIIFLHKNEQSNLVKKTTNGLGVNTEIIYQPLTNNTIYTKGSGAVLPVIDLQFPWYVATQTNTDNGLNGYFTTDYKYEGLKLHKKGKGILGFQKLESTNHTSNTVSTLTFEIFENDNMYYHQYLVNEKVTEISTGSKISETINTFGVKPNMVNNFIYTPVIIESINKTYDLGGEFVRRSKTVQNLSDLDEYGNSTKSTVYVDEDPTGEYDYQTEIKAWFTNNPGNWLISRPDSIKVTRKKSGEVDDYVATELEYYSGSPLVMQKTIQPNGNSGLEQQFDYDYDVFGNPTKQTLGAPGFRFNGEPIDNRITEFDYDTDNNYDCRFLTGVTNRANGATYKSSFNYNTTLGTTTGVTAPDNLLTEFDHDPFDRLEVVTKANGATSHSYLYWNDNHEYEPLHAEASYFQYTYAKGNGNPLSQMKGFRFYDNLGRLLRSVSFGLKNEVVYTDYHYNSKGLLQKVSEPYFSDNAATQFTVYSYDDLNRVDTIVLPNYNLLINQYQGRTVVKKNEGTQVTTSTTVNALGQTESITDPTGTITYQYFSSGNVKDINALGAITTMTYDDAGRRETLTEPNAGQISYIYNPYGELMEQTDARQNTYRMKYDQLSRLYEKKLLSTGEITRYLYNDIPPGQGESGGGYGKISQVIGHNGFEYIYVYDEFSRLKTQIEEHPEMHSGEIAYAAHYTYDPDLGRLDTYTYPTGFAVDYDYASNGMLWRVTEMGTNHVLWENKEVNSRGQITGYDLGNGLSTQKKFDDYGFPTGIITGDVQHLGYRFDPVTGNLAYRSDSIYNLTEHFGYDHLLKSRLTSWQVEGEQYFSMSYENNGNIQTKLDVTLPGLPGGTYEYGQDAGPHAVTGITLPTPEYLAADPAVQQIAYTPFNKVSNINHTSGEIIRKLEIDYGPDEARKITRYYEIPGIGDWTLKRTKHFALGNYEVEVDPSGNERKLHYLRGGDGLLAIFVKNNGRDTMYYVHKDYLGSYETVTDDNGAVKDKLNYDAWGRRRNPLSWKYESSPWPHLFDRGFTGHEHLEEFNLINMNGRVYDQRLGRFLSPDPFVQAPGYSQNYNRYSYAFNNPLKYVDPSGYNAFEKEGDDISGQSGNYDYGHDFFPGPPSIGNPNTLIGTGKENIYYNEHTGLYTNTWNISNVSYKQVHNNIILPNSATVSGFAAQSFYSNMVGGMDIYVVNAFGRSTLVSAFGRLGSMDIASNGGISFTNPTAAAYSCEAVAISSRWGDGYGYTFGERLMNLPRAIWNGDVFKKTPNAIEVGFHNSPASWIIPGGGAAKGLKGASVGLKMLFKQGVRGNSIINIRTLLLRNGFTQTLSLNKSGYLFKNSFGEQIRIMSRGSKWDIRMMNKYGNYLDEFGNVGSPQNTHNIFVWPW